MRVACFERERVSDCCERNACAFILMSVNCDTYGSDKKALEYTTTNVVCEIYGRIQMSRNAKTRMSESSICFSAGLLIIIRSVDSGYRKITRITGVDRVRRPIDISRPIR